MEEPREAREPWQEAAGWTPGRGRFLPGESVSGNKMTFGLSGVGEVAACAEDGGRPGGGGRGCALRENVTEKRGSWRLRLAVLLFQEATWRTEARAEGATSAGAGQGRRGCRGSAVRQRPPQTPLGPSGSLEDPRLLRTDAGDPTLPGISNALAAPSPQDKPRGVRTTWWTLGPLRPPSSGAGAKL
ncbi:hypothetical protein P7K49_010247 [Saguinus oedipus]|uniref:Uncharacterized protein n=1 Tax=Saguinus oedipus TaxID=9490 RepID=A0ABQ9VM88_SAGOE|nr:hypothetical protein P7K49_010247 [Saguinus oedipus]